MPASFSSRFAGKGPVAVVRARRAAAIAFLAVSLMLCGSGSALGFCFEQAGEYYGVAPELLMSIAKVESGMNPQALNVNRNGTYDVGIMQVNSSWRKFLGEELWSYMYHDACWNVFTGAYILAKCMAKYGQTWQAVGCYHSQTPSRNKSYAWKVYGKVYGEPPPPPVVKRAHAGRPALEKAKWSR